jgi:hypothetical protein
MSAASAMSRRKPVSREAIVQLPRYVAPGLAGFAARRQNREVSQRERRRKSADWNGDPGEGSSALPVASHLWHGGRPGRPHSPGGGLRSGCAGGLRSAALGGLSIVR